MSKGQKNKLKELPVGKAGHFEQQSKVLLNYNLEYKINIYKLYWYKWIIE